MRAPAAMKRYSFADDALDELASTARPMMSGRTDDERPLVDRMLDLFEAMELVLEDWGLTRVYGPKASLMAHVAVERAFPDTTLEERLELGRRVVEAARERARLADEEFRRAELSFAQAERDEVLQSGGRLQ